MTILFTRASMRRLDILASNNCSKVVSCLHYICNGERLLLTFCDLCLISSPFLASVHSFADWIFCCPLAISEHLTFFYNQLHNCCIDILIRIFFIICWNDPHGGWECSIQWGLLQGRFPCAQQNAGTSKPKFVHWRALRCSSVW